MVNTVVYLDYEKHGTRTLSTVLRIGDKMAINIGNGIEQLRVVGVQWGGDQEQCEAAVFCNRTER